MPDEVIRVKIDLVALQPEGGCTLVLVETGPWPEEEKQQQLERLAERIRDCATAVLAGQVAERYPATAGEPITIQVDSYDTPRLEVDIVVAKAQNALRDSAEVQQQLAEARFTPAIAVRHRWSDFEKEYQKRAGKLGRLRRWLGLGE